MAIGAHRGLAVAASDRLAVNALHKLLLHGLVTLGASGGYIEAKDGRVLVGSSENFVRPVTVGADRRLLRACRHGFTVDTLQIGSEGLRAMAASLHDIFLSVARSASGRDVHVTHARFRIAGG